MNQPTDRPSSSTKVSFADTREERGEEAEEGPAREGKTTYNHLFPSHSPLSLVIMLRGPGRVYITTTIITIIIGKGADTATRHLRFQFFFINTTLSASTTASLSFLP